VFEAPFLLLFDGDPQTGLNTSLASRAAGMFDRITLHKCKGYRKIQQVLDGLSYS
jgi:hypothetical protein